MVVRMISWEIYTWESHVVSLKEQLAQHDEQRKDIENNLERAERELNAAMMLGVEKNHLPSDYGRLHLEDKP